MRRVLLVALAWTWNAALTAQSLAGRILEEHSAKPVPSARIQVKTRSSPQTIADLDTDSNGTFRSPLELQPGDYELRVTKSNYAPALVGLAVPLAAPLTIRLVRFGSITGQIRDSQGQPVAGMTVVPFRADAQGRLGQIPTAIPARTDETGRYRLYNLTPGRYALSAMAGSPGVPSSTIAAYPFGSGERPDLFTITSGTRLEGVDLPLAAAPTLSFGGHVGASEREVRAVVSLVRREQPSLPVAMGFTGAGGAFRFSGLAPGAYELLASGPTAGYAAFGAMVAGEPQFARAAVELAADRQEQAITLESGRTVQLTLKAGSGCPETATVLLQPVENWGALLDRSVDLNGKIPLTVRHLAPAPYRVTVVRPAETCFGSQARIVDARTVETIPIDVVPGGSIEGRVQAPERQPLVELKALADGDEARQTTPGSGGRFVFARLRPGTYQIRAGDVSREVTVEGGAIASVEFEPPTEKRP